MGVGFVIAVILIVGLSAIICAIRAKSTAMALAGLFALLTFAFALFYNTPTVDLSDQLKNLKNFVTGIGISKVDRAIKVGSVIKFGSYDWRVLDVQEDKALIITKNVIEQSAYNSDWVEVTWETCTLRRYLNDEFLQKFTSEEQGRIIETRINNPSNLWYDTPGGINTTDKIFLLSLEEVDRYFGNSNDYQMERRKMHENGFGSKIIAVSDGYFLSNAYDSVRQAKFGNEASWWWLRSPGNGSDYAASVDAGGGVGVGGYGVILASGGVRPALWLNLSS